MTTRTNESVLTKRQHKTFGPKPLTYYGEPATITVEVRYDDDCGNGHNSFSITATIYEKGRDVAGGCLHEEVAKAFPELAPFIKFHLCSSDEPMHYLANTLYWLGFSGWCNGKPNDPPNLTHARSMAVWPDMPESMLASNGASKEEVTCILESRLASLQSEFRTAVESLGFTW